MNNYDKETAQAVSSFLYLKQVMEEIAKTVKERAEQQEREGK